MADIMLFGATGFTGRLTAEALARRGADFAIAGRNRAKLEELARSTGSPDIHLANVEDVDSLARALGGSRVLITCVGPFVELGTTAVEAALAAGVHYLDSTGEAVFVHKLIEEFDARARSRGIALAPSIGFDEVPADVGLTLACGELQQPSAAVTFAAPRTGSAGTVRSALHILTSAGWGVTDGKIARMTTGERERWVPMPPPLGVRRSISAPLAIGRLAPMHIDFDSLQVFVTTGTPQRLALKAGVPAARAALKLPRVRTALFDAVGRLTTGPGSGARRKRWTVLVEARSHGRYRNVVITGRDVYGLTGELLAAGAITMADEKYSGRGVMAPVEAIGLETLHKELLDFGVTIETFEPV
jgi:short subunit dehydrogenase-like uncharacterized protein